MCLKKIFFIQYTIYVEKKCIFAAELMIKDELWCNGSTTDFGSACVGSSPASSTEKTLTDLVGVFFTKIAESKFNRYRQ